MPITIDIETLKQVDPESLALLFGQITATELLEISRTPEFTQLAYRCLVRLCFPNDYFEARAVMAESAELFPNTPHTIDWEKFYNALNSAFAIPSKTKRLETCHLMIKDVHQKMFFSSEPLLPTSDTEYALFLLFSFKKPEILAQLQTYQLQKNFDSPLSMLITCLSSYFLPVASWSSGSPPLDCNQEVVNCCILSGNVEALKHVLPKKVDAIKFVHNIVSTAIWLGHKDVIEHLLKVFPDEASHVFTAASFYARYLIAGLAFNQADIKETEQWLSRPVFQLAGGSTYFNPRRLDCSLFEHLDPKFAALMLRLFYPNVYSRPNSCEKFLKAARENRKPDNIFLRGAKGFGLEFETKALPVAAAKRKTGDAQEMPEPKRVSRNTLNNLLPPKKPLAKPTNTSSNKPRQFLLSQQSSTTQARPVYYSSSSKPAPYQLPEQSPTTQTPAYNSNNRLSLPKPRPLSSLFSRDDSQLSSLSFTNSDELMTDIQTVKSNEQNLSDLANFSDDDSSSYSTGSSLQLFFQSSDSSSSIGTQSDSDDSDDDDIVYTNRRPHPATPGLRLPRKL